MNFKRRIRIITGYILAEALILSGYLSRARKKSFKPGVITSVAFHNPSEKLFGEMVVWLRKKGFTFISASQLIDILSGKVECPRGAIWFSLDDGWRNNLTKVLPVAVEYEIPVTVFICTGAIEGGAFWWRKVMQFPDLVPPELRNINTLKKQPEEVRKQVVQHIDEAGVSPLREAMTVDEVKKISEMTQVELGAHTDTHPILPNCSEQQIEEELATSKRKLEEWTGKSITVFAYPNGSYDGRERRILEAEGYKLAATTEDEYGRINSNPYFFPRHIIMDDGSFAENICHALGIWAPLIKRIKRIFG
ncbi:MAG TPA: polysaccharide deacetylase family protein [Dehalococcoidia bacterium]|nr:polysaccharide deacetylase family protein [Dehalococcoidia bacterium]